MKELPICDTLVCHRGRRKAHRAAEEAAGRWGGQEGVESIKWEGSTIMRLKEKCRLSNLRRVVSLMDSG